MREGKMSLPTEKRTSVRYLHQGDITFSIFNQQDWVDGQSIDYCTEGLKFQSICALHPGTTIYIRVKPGECSSQPNGFCECLRSATLAEVKWCREIDGTDVSLYEVGVRYYPPHY